MDDVLVAQVKRKLHITWDDEHTNAVVDDIIPTAKAVIIEKVGITDPDYNFTTPGPENLLFLALCFYLYNDAEDEFEANYFTEILQTRRKWELREVEDA